MKINIKAIIMDDRHNGNHHIYSAAALKQITKQTGVKVYSNLAPGAAPLEENFIGDVASFSTVKTDDGATRLCADCILDSENPAFQSFSEAFVLAPDGEGVVAEDGTITDYSMSCMALVPPENAAWGCSCIYEVQPGDPIV